MFSHHTIRSVAAAGALALLASACSSSANPDAAGSKADRELTVAVATLTATLDPAADLSASYLRAVGAAEGLMKVRPDGSVAPELARSVTQDSPTQWTVALDPTRTFWSGTPVDAAAVAASLKRAVELNELAAGQLAGVTPEVVDAWTLRLTTAKPQPGLPYALAHYQLVIHNVAAYAKTEEGTATPEQADLTGPYRVTAFHTDRDLTLEAYDDWWGGEPGYETVRVTAVSDPQARAELAISGQSDLVADYPVDRAAELTGTPTELVTTAAANTVSVYVNARSRKAPALRDVRVRQALAWGVDRDELVQLTTGDTVDPVGTWLSSSPAVAAETEDGYTYDADRAAALLDAAGWKRDGDVRTRDGKPLRLRLLTFGAEKATGEVLQAQWKELGIDVEVRDVENTAVADAIESGDWDLATQAWTTLGDHATLLAGQIGPDGAANHAGLKPVGVPALLDRAHGAPDADDRTAALVALDRVITEQVPLVPLHPRVVATAVDESVTGFAAHALQYETLVTGDLAPAS